MSGPVVGSKNNVSPEFEKRLWEQASGMTSFTQAQLARTSGVNRWTVERALSKWQKEGRLNTLRREGRSFVYCVVPDAVTAATAIEAPGTGQSVEGNLWIAIRTLRRGFTAQDLSIAATTGTVEVTERAARDYCGMLIRAGVLTAQTKAVPGHRKARYRLARDLGPQAPRRKRIEVLHDPNSRSILHLSAGGAA